MAQSKRRNGLKKRKESSEGVMRREKKIAWGVGWKKRQRSEETCTMRERKMKNRIRSLGREYREKKTQKKRRKT